MMMMNFRCFLSNVRELHARFDLCLADCKR